MKKPTVDMGACILCEVCIDVAPHAFHLNDLGFVELLPLASYEDDENILEAVKNCPKDCISWEED